jgi:hypothetical protein
VDPDAALAEITYQLSRGTDCDPSIDDTVDDLRSWLDHGGFAPDWDRHGLATRYYQTRQVQNKTHRVG